MIYILDHIFRRIGIILAELFCDVDDFCKVFIPQWRKQLLEDGTRKRQREAQMTTS
jgi:hypothetical protein